MKTCVLSLIAIGLGLSLNVAVAERGDGPGKRGHGRHRGARVGLLMKALDADQDGALSAEEIENAPTALLTLDQDQDGMLSRDEIRPPRPPRGAVAERIMGFDEDGDGLVTAEELPERMQRILSVADTNGDEAIDQAEAQAFEEQRQLQRRGPRGRRGAPLDEQE